MTAGRTACHVTTAKTHGDLLFVGTTGTYFLVFADTQPGCWCLADWGSPRTGRLARGASWSIALALQGRDRKAQRNHSQPVQRRNPGTGNWRMQTVDYKVVVAGARMCSDMDSEQSLTC